MSKQLLGDILVDNGEISQAQLDEAFAIQKKEGGFIGIILVNFNYLDEQSLVKYLAIQAERVVQSD
jgi:hypothetical protein